MSVPCESNVTPILQPRTAKEGDPVAHFSTMLIPLTTASYVMFPVHQEFYKALPAAVMRTKGYSITGCCTKVAAGC